MVVGVFCCASVAQLVEQLPHKQSVQVQVLTEVLSIEPKEVLYMAWSSSDRLSRLPADWQARRRRVLLRDRHACQVAGCPTRANQVDHIEHSGPDDDWNLQSLCEFHHNQKSAAEGHAARAKLRKLLRREPEVLPGSIDPKDAVPRARKGW